MTPSASLGRASKLTIFGHTMVCWAAMQACSGDAQRQEREFTPAHIPAPETGHSVTDH